MSFPPKAISIKSSVFIIHFTFHTLLRICIKENTDLRKAFFHK